ncbi:MAG: hypothetical protein WC428_01250 [Candidatus Paceibacterota bacterium]|jgi:hypothetical protein
MSILFRNWLEEGYYEEDSWGNLTRIEDPDRIFQAQKEGTLYHNDGMATTQVYLGDKLDLNGESD